LERTEPTTVQLCGKVVLELRGRRIEPLLPSRQGLVLFAYLALNRTRATGRDELIDALWGDAIPANAANALTALLSKLRAVLGTDVLAGRSSIQLMLPVDARVDVEHALAAVHRAESAVALGSWARGWSAALSAQFIAARPLLQGCDRPWIDAWRRRLDDTLERALEAYAAACLGLGGTELHAAERAARRLLERSPLRETGYQLLMQSLAARGNVAEALVVYEQARTVLRDQLGTTPGPGMQALHSQLLHNRAPIVDPAP
jgi:SARP family transcriptional regulator, regulator of embCAB operon